LSFIDPMKRLLILYFLIVTTLSIGGYFAFREWLVLDEPEVPAFTLPSGDVEQVNDSLRVWGNQWLHLNDYGIYEMYIEGKPYERGVVAGRLSKSLVAYQEKAFMDRIWELVPSMPYQRFLRLLIALFNRTIDSNIPQEYLLEIYGMSRVAADEYDYVGPKYDRILQYHGAHDIGHMLQNYSLVGCSSFAVWNSKSEDSTLLVGRNFDFYVGDAFAEHKIVEFCKPDSGYGFMMVTWGGMCGVVSGMNEQGLTVTINASRSAIPVHVADPVSLIAREILQYSANIDQAYKIAESRHCFVSESYLVASANDNRAVVIEKSPYAIAMYEETGNQILCTNHFQSAQFSKDPSNISHQQRSASVPRYQRLAALLARDSSLSVMDAANILRNRRGAGDREVGMGNEKVLNQLIAHHSIIFKPAQRMVWISTSPYQLGSYIAYDLKQILASPELMLKHKQIYKKALTLPADSFLDSRDWENFQQFKKLTLEITGAAPEKGLSDTEIQAYIELNKDFFYTWEVCGDYYLRKHEITKARECYQEALSRDIPTLDEQERIVEKEQKCLGKN